MHEEAQFDQEPRLFKFRGKIQTKAKKSVREVLPFGPLALFCRRRAEGTATANAVESQVGGKEKGTATVTRVQPET